MLYQYAMRVIRSWSGGPHKGGVIRVAAARREQLKRTGMAEDVEPEKGSDAPESRPTITLKDKRKSRHAALNG
jgi:hypothetical protein